MYLDVLKDIAYSSIHINLLYLTLSSSSLKEKNHLTYTVMISEFEVC